MKKGTVTANGKVVSLIPAGDGECQGISANWDRWNIPARDDKGHYARAWFKLPPQLLGLIQITMDSKKYPYKSIGSFYRDAVVEKLQTLRRLPDYEDGVGSTLHTLQAMFEIVRESDYMFEFLTMFDRLEEAEKQFRNRGERGMEQLRKMVLRVWGELKQMNDEFWRTEFELELKRRWGKILELDDAGSEDDNQ
jgi:hypothetical protein